jgi:DNA (cytosine-5)-methyltransferase 1
MTITFSDLFAGIGGFHAVGELFGWEHAYSCDINDPARRVYEQNWGCESATDITLDATDGPVNIPKHDVLFAGFPCQPFSKSGKQQGMDEARGTLFWNIARILEVKRPKVVLLENVPNLVGPRHTHEWEVIIKTLHSLGYRVSKTPFIVSPHKVSPEFGGRPQTRSRIYIAATYVPAALRKKFPLDAENLSFEKYHSDWDPKKWNVLRDISIDRKLPQLEFQELSISEAEESWLSAWDDFLQKMLVARKDVQLPGFPFWADVWLGNIKHSKNDPDWKTIFINKNIEFYESHQRGIDAWLKKNNYLEDFPSSRRKFEWQGGNMKSLWDGLIQLRPSGIRVKKADYVPAAVAITQTSVVGKLKRRLTVREVARLQGLPEWFSFDGQSNTQSYKQLGNGISITTAYLAIKALVERDKEILEKTSPELLKSVLKSHDNFGDHRKYTEIRSAG